MSRARRAASLNRLGLELASEGREPEAVQCFRRGLQLAPDPAQGYLTLAKDLHQAGRHEEARAACERALELRPGWPEGLAVRDSL